MVVMATAALLTGAPVAVSAQDQTQSTVRGVVTDETGQPLRGVQVVAQCASLTACDTTYRSEKGTTDSDGRYEIVIRGIGEFWVSASVMVDGIQVPLAAEPNAPFTRAEDATRNLRVRYYPGTMDTLGTGGIVLIDRATGLWPEFSGLEVTLTPTDHDGPAITRTIRRHSAEGWIVDGFRPGAYRITARQGNTAWLLAPHGTTNYATEYRGRFTNSGTKQRHILLQGRPGDATTAPPPNTGSPGPTDDPGPAPAGAQFGTPTNVPVAQREFPLWIAAKAAGRWIVRPLTMSFQTNQVTVVLRVWNNTILNQTVASSFRFTLNGRSNVPQLVVSSSLEPLPGEGPRLDPSPFMSAVAPINRPPEQIPPGRSALVRIVFSLPQAEQTAIRSLSVVAIDPRVTPLLGRPQENPPVEFPLYSRPRSDEVPTTSQGKTDEPSGQAQDPAPNPTPAPSPPPYSGPPPVAGDTRVVGPTTVIGDLSAQVVGLSHRDGTLGREVGTTVYADLINQSRAPMPLAAGQVRAELIGSGGKTAATGLELYINDLKQTWGDDFSIAPGQTVRLVARYPMSVEAQRGVSGWILSAGDRSFEFRLPPGDSYFRTQSAVYPDPVPPSPTPGMEAEMRALEGVYTVLNFGELTLRYEGGLLLGETRVRAGQPAMDTLKLAMPRSGRLQGLMQRTDQPPSRAWYTLDLTVSPDRARLQGELGNVHPPINTPRAFTAQRSGPAPAPAPAPAGGQQGQNSTPVPATGTGSTGTPAATAAAPATPTRVGPYDVVMVSVQRGADGDWESTWSVTNRSQATTRVNLSDLSVTMRAADGQTSTASGPYHYAGETGRRVRSSGFEIQPGEETKIRFWHSRSSQMTPAGYTFRAGASESAISGGQSAASAGAFQHTAYLDMKVDRVAPSANGGVEVTLTARHDGDIRRGIQHDPQQYAVVGSDGEEYRWDGNYYGASGTQRLSNTVYLTRSQGVVTYVFPQAPAGVTPVRLILRQNGQQTASFDLPR